MSWAGKTTVVSLLTGIALGGMGGAALWALGGFLPTIALVGAAAVFAAFLQDRWEEDPPPAIYEVLVKKPGALHDGIRVHKCREYSEAEAWARGILEDEECSPQRDGWTVHVWRETVDREQLLVLTP